MDFTDSAHPSEIAFFDRGPIAPEDLVLGGYWSAYWYHGRIYGTEIARGLDVFALTPSAQMTENEIAAAALADQGRTFNPQQQFPVSWPDHPVVALAYLDQLQRSGAVAPADVVGLARCTRRGAVRTWTQNGAIRRWPRRSTDLARGLKAPASADAATNGRESALRKTLSGITAQLR